MGERPKTIMNKEKTVILKVLVGSRAHGLSNANSDYDYRAVYVLPTSQMLSIGYRYKGNSHVEGIEDNTSYEIGHFLHLATKCNPTILEVFKAPIIEANKDGKRLRKLFPYIWTPQQSFNAFVGYGLNQRKKFLNKKDNRQDKYACAYIRTLWNLIELLESKDFSVDITKSRIFKDLVNFKTGNYNMGEVINLSEMLTEIAQENLNNCSHEADINKVNEFLLDIRRRYW